MKRMLGIVMALALAPVPAAVAAGHVVAGAAPPFSVRLSVGDPAGIPIPAHPRALFDRGIAPRVSRTDALAQAAAGTTIQMWSGSVTDGSPFPFTMVGKDPFTTLTSPSTSINTYLVSVAFSVPATGHSYDPAAAEPCDPAAASPLSRVQASPVFLNKSYSWGGTAIGTTQYVDAFQRSEFWSQTSPSGINPGYHVRLKLGTNTLEVLVTVDGAPAEIAGACASDNLMVLDLATWDSLVQTQLLPLLASSGVGPTTFPIFLLHNVALSDGFLCCVLGYHSAFGSPAQTYAVADYDTTKLFGAGVKDIAPLSHEVAEWMDDPLGTNSTNAWGNTGQVTGCQSNLEVADPLSGTLLRVSRAGFAYHPQEIAFFSWFFHQSPSLGVNGWYSNNATFTAPAASCP